MTTGLFTAHNSGATLWAKQKAKQRRGKTLDQFAEMLAEGVSHRDAATRLGFQADYGKNLLRKLRQDLGWRAV